MVIRTELGVIFCLNVVSCSFCSLFFFLIDLTRCGGSVAWGSDCMSWPGINDVLCIKILFPLHLVELSHLVKNKASLL
jgi:hypothetical protein